MQAVPSDRHPALLSAPRAATTSRAGRALWGAALVSALLSVAVEFWRTSEVLPPSPVAAAAPAVVAPPATVSVPPPLPLPDRLSDTGLYVRGSTIEVDPQHLLYVPQYPLWTDGATKRRYVRLPAGTQIDASKADAWEFPVGTRFWKEFSFSGERAETRMIEKLPDGNFRYAAYVWDAARRDAFLAPESGVRAVAAIRAGIEHDVPSESDCRACHEGRPGRVLGFDALQLSPDRDPLAANRESVPAGAVDLDELARRGWLANLPPRLLERAPRIVARSAKGRAALGYLYGNCAHCHNPEGPLAELDLDLDQSAFDAKGEARTRASLVARASHFRVTDEGESVRVAPGRPNSSALFYRLTSRNPAAQMPPLGTKLVDPAGAALVRAWIASDVHQPRQ